MTKTKKFLSMAMILVLMIAFAAPVGATVEGTKGTVVVTEKFDYEDGDINGKGSWIGVTSFGGSATPNTGIVVEEGKLVIPANTPKNTGVALTVGAQGTTYEFGYSTYDGRQKADEYVVEFDAEIGKYTWIYLSRATTTSFIMKNDGSEHGGTGFLKNQDRNNVNNWIYLPDGEHHYKIVLKPYNYSGDATNGYTLLTREDTKINPSRLVVKADIYVDGECHVMGETAWEYTGNKPWNEAILLFSVISAENNCGQTTIDNIEFYYLDNETRSDVSTRFMATNTVSENYDYLTLFDHTKPAEKMNATGSKLVAEIRYDGTQAEDEDVKVFLAQFGADGMLKSVNMGEGTISAGSTDKVTVTLESTADAPLFDAENIADDDYLQAFVWTADGMVPLCAERTAGNITE